MPLQIVFAGTPDFAAAHLAAVHNSEHEVVAVYTQPDRRAGRGKTLAASAVKTLALDNDLPVFQPATLKDEHAQAELAALQCNVMVVVAYGLLLPQAVLDIPKLGCINVHASLLPRWRGAAPIQRAIEAGDARTGVTIMQMEAGLDTGPMLNTISCDIADDDTGASLHDKLAGMGPQALLETLADLTAYQANAQQQDDAQANYAHKLDKREALIDWHTDATTLCRRIRAFNPVPMCYTLLQEQRLKIYAAHHAGNTHAAPGTITQADEEGIVVATGQGAITITALQLPGGNAMSAQAMLNARRNLFAPGTILGTVDPS